MATRFQENPSTASLLTLGLVGLGVAGAAWWYLSWNRPDSKAQKLSNDSTLRWRAKAQWSSGGCSVALTSRDAVSAAEEVIRMREYGQEPCFKNAAVTIYVTDTKIGADETLFEVAPTETSAAVERAKAVQKRLESQRT